MHMTLAFRLTKLSYITALSVFSMSMSVAALAADSPAKPGLVIVEAEGVAITSLDLEAELMKAPPDVRNSLFFRKDGLAQLASNLLMRRVLAKQAEASTVVQDPVTKSALQLARDRVLSDAQLVRMDQMNKPTEAVLEQRAREIYRAEGNRFEVAEEVQASHILLLSTEPDAEQKAAQILADVKAGKDFAELAKASSQDPGSGSKGGDLGFFKRGRMVKEFEDTAFKMKVGEVSDVIKSQFGYHIIKVTDRKEPGKQPFEQVRDALMNEASQKILTEGRIKAGEKIMSGAKAHPEALDAYVASQPRSN